MCTHRNGSAHTTIIAGTTAASSGRPRTIVMTNGMHRLATRHTGSAMTTPNCAMRRATRSASRPPASAPRSALTTGTIPAASSVGNSARMFCSCDAGA